MADDAWMGDEYQRLDEGHALFFERFLPSKQALEAAIKTLSAVVSSDFRANEIEVAVSTTEKPLFRKLSE